MIVFRLSRLFSSSAVSLWKHPLIASFFSSGSWPFGGAICNFWVTCDVLCCSSSIYHMCVISVSRYYGIKNPLHARQAQLVSRRGVWLKIAIVWLIAAIITSPITILALIDQNNVQPEDDVCGIANKYFKIIGKSINEKSVESFIDKQFDSFIFSFHLLMSSSIFWGALECLLFTN